MKTQKTKRLPRHLFQTQMQLKDWPFEAQINFLHQMSLLGAEIGEVCNKLVAEQKAEKLALTRYPYIAHNPVNVVDAWKDNRKERRKELIKNIDKNIQLMLDQDYDGFSEMEKKLFNRK